MSNSPQRYKVPVPAGTFKRIFPHLPDNPMLIQCIGDECVMPAGMKAIRLDTKFIHEVEGIQYLVKCATVLGKVVYSLEKLV